MRARKLTKLRQRGAQRVRDCRRRQRTGRALLKVEVNVVSLCDLLVAAGFLEQWNDQDRRAIEQALETAIDVWSQP
jgi:hypothetical protein